ncbi:O-fucosyltransferase 38 isoform X3 [Ziziphus jujuba]|uniref:O-fucosyltransferase family protein n=1 Tax=Ziziphus jujuba TaxID=326968 RepID=A0A6P4A687_ZIZJJ|nr:O-fucosyltransferase 38 isoform X3 [Ziziphus jujuba]
MVNRGAHHSRTIFSSATARIFPRKPSPFTITLQIFFLFAFSILLFLFYTRNSFEYEQKHPYFSRESLLNQVDVHSTVEMSEEQLWYAPFSHGVHPCIEPTAKYKAAIGSDRYMTVRSNGGLNQMRTGISDMVAVAHIMNATLVIPQLDKRSFWHDSSTFSDIFDELHFIQTLRGDVQIVKELPQELEALPRARKHFVSWSGVSYYEELTQLWKDYQKLVERLRARGGRYIALHLRYEKDMLAYTGCTYGLSDAESEELRIMRENTKHWKVKNINSTEQRVGGFCPLTPKEVGIFLKALGYPPSTPIYIAAGEIYGGNAHLLELTSRFPNVVFKETLATHEELRAFANHASQTAALDYIISIESDVFVPSYSGNMARAVEGHRRFLGHRKTISPDRKGLVEVFDMVESGQLERSMLSYLVQQMHEDRQGAPRKRRGPIQGIKGRGRFRTEENFYENPYPECICTSKRHFQ